MATDPPRSTVYYDGSCPLCRAEIGHYRRKDQSGALCFVDVSEPIAVIPDGLTQQQAMKRFHVRTGRGTIVSGAAAFVEVWARLPRWRWAARAAALPGVLALLELGYRLFLPARPTFAAIFGRVKRLTGMRWPTRRPDHTDSERKHDIPRTRVMDKRPQKDLTIEASKNPKQSEFQHQDHCCGAAQRPLG